VSNIWRSHQLKPHRVKTFKLSRDLHGFVNLIWPLLIF